MSPRLFTKVLTPVIAYIWKMGIKISLYLYDILIVGNSHHCRGVDHPDSSLSLETGRLYIINLKKSELTLVQDIVYIGGNFCMDLACIFLSHQLMKVLISFFLSCYWEDIYKQVHQFLG